MSDELLAIDNTRVGDDLSKAIAFKKAGDTVSITVNRNGLIKDISVLLTTSPKSSYSLDKMEKPTEKQLKIYKKWLRLD